MQRGTRNGIRVVALWIGIVLLGFDATAQPSGFALPSRLGVEDHLREWPELTSAVRDRASDDLPQAVMTRIQGLLDEAYSPERLQSRIEQGISAEASTERLLVLSQIAESPIFVRHRQLIEDQRRPSGLRLQPIRMGDVLKDGPVRPRLMAIGRLSSATGLSGNLLALANSIGESIARAHQSLSCRAPAAADEAADQLRAEIAVAARQFGSYALHLLNLSYWDEPQQQIDAMADVMESADLRWFHERLRHHLGLALHAAKVEFAGGIDRLRVTRCPAP